MVDWKIGAKEWAQKMPAHKAMRVLKRVKSPQKMQLENPSRGLALDVVAHLPGHVELSYQRDIVRFVRKNGDEESPTSGLPAIREAVQSATHGAISLWWVNEDDRKTIGIAVNGAIRKIAPHGAEFCAAVSEILKRPVADTRKLSKRAWRKIDAHFMQVGLQLLLERLACPKYVRFQ